MTTELEQRSAVVAAAREWIGTPYHNCADIKGVGVDCGMLLVRVFVDLGLVEPFDPRPYSPDWHLHRDAERYLDWVRSWCGEVSDPQPGDLVVFRYGRCYSHGGIVTETRPLTIVHAYMETGCVDEEAVHRNPRLSDEDRARLYFSLWKRADVGSTRKLEED